MNVAKRAGLRACLAIALLGVGLPAQQQPTTPQVASPNPQQPATPPPTAAPQAAVSKQRRFLVVIDPAHGGSDRGAALGFATGLPEKDVTLALARRLRSTLWNRGITATLLRDSDATLTLEQRAIAVNVARPTVFLSVHATIYGTGVQLYTAQLQPPTGPTPTFLPWSRAQSWFLPQSRRVLDAVAHELTNAQISVASLAVYMRPLNNAACPAIAIELAPASAKTESLWSAKYQDSVANAVATAITTLRDSLEPQP